MPQPDTSPPALLRRSLYWLLIAIGIGAVIGRILAVDSVDRRGLPSPALAKKLDEKKTELQKQGRSEAEIEDALDREKNRLQFELGIRRPFLSANDRSRWCTVRALVEPELRVPGAAFSIDNVIQQPGWDTIDMVKHDGHLYSSKPPLLPTLMAAEYWVIYRVTGISLGKEPYAIGRFMLITINVASLLVYFYFLMRLIERLGTSDWGRLFVMAAAVFGTFVTTFATVLTNHLVGAACAAAVVETLVRIWFDGDHRAWTFALAGFFGAFLVTNELPAAALAAGAGAVLLVLDWRMTLKAYLAPALVVTVAFFALNWISVGSLKPAYMHRGGTDDWYNYSYVRNGREIKSYWADPKGIDRGEPSPGRYCLHVLVGHHGIFSLTPIWLLSLGGAIYWLVRPLEGRGRGLALLIGGVTLICMAFYLFSPGVDRNYGGQNAGFRWVFWMAPMWLCMMLPAADGIASRRWARAVAVLLLLMSALSASYPTWNPWTAPWIMDLMQYAK